jgi:hypothetical protein
VNSPLLLPRRVGSVMVDVQVRITPVLPDRCQAIRAIVASPMGRLNPHRNAATSLRREPGRSFRRKDSAEGPAEFVS